MGWLRDEKDQTGSRRPAVIVNDNNLGKLPLKVIVPITDWKDRYQIAAWMVQIHPDAMNGLSKVSSIDCFQMRSVSEKRFVEKLSEVNLVQKDQIKKALAKVLTIE